MKKFLLSALIITAFSSFTYISFNEVINAIKSGNADEVAKYFDNYSGTYFARKKQLIQQKPGSTCVTRFF